MSEPVHQSLADVPRKHYWRRLALLAAVYVAAGRFGMVLAVPPGFVASIWPPAGLAIAAMLIWGPAVWPAIWLATFVGDLWVMGESGTLTLPGSPIVASVLGSVAILQAWLASSALRRWMGPHLVFNSAVRVPLFVATAVVACLFSALLSVTMLCAGGIFPWRDFGALWLTWGVGDVCGVLVVTPLVMAWTDPAQRLDRRRAPEVAALLAALVVLGVLIFGGRFDHRVFQNPYWFFPFFGWAALRLGPRGATLATALVSAFATWETAHGNGPFVSTTYDGSFLMLGMFTAVVSLTGLVVVALVAERDDRESALRTSEERLRLVLSGAPILLTATDRQGVFVLCEGRLGPFESATLHGQSVFELFGHRRFVEADGRDSPVEAVLTRVLEGESVAGVVEMEKRFYESRITPRRASDGVVVGMISIATDVTDARHLQDRTREAQKMEAMGRLAGGIAHDFNNLLTVILGHCEFLLDRVRSNPELRNDVEEMRYAAERAAAITHQLLTFSRHHVQQPRVLDLNKTVTGFESMLRRLLGDNVSLDTRLEPELCLVKADETQIQQVLLNLVINARDAMALGGTVTVETRTLHVPEPGGSSEPRPYAAITVTDTGIGMDAATKQRIFEPFFTTKKPMHGTGLGLATVYGIVQQSGGMVHVESEPGRGASFLVCLPAVTDAVSAADGPRATGDSALAGLETILLAEDDSGIRQVVRHALETHGYKVLEARDGEEALRVLERHANPIDLLLTDVLMPRMNGRALRAALDSRLPALKVLYLSGHMDDESVRSAAREPGGAFLEKPFAPSDLVRKVREVLDSVALVH